MTTFKDAKVGDRVWRLDYGKWVTIDNVVKADIYPIKIRTDHFTMDGAQQGGGDWRVLFWDEINITAPPKPLPKLEVDTKVLVWDFEEDKYKIRGHFSHFNKYGSIFIFANGTTSWSSSSTVGYRNWELAKE